VAQVIKAPDGGRLIFESSGDPAGMPVFLLHGTPGALGGPRPRGIFLYRLGIRLITYNRPGYPGSDRRIGRRVADAATDVELVANHLGIDQFSVVGRSGGAPHALACGADTRLHDRVICVAALCGLAPCDAKGLDWSAGMAESNVRRYADAERNLGALIVTLNQLAEQVRNNSQGLLNSLWPELVSSDKQVIGDIALRRIIAQTHADALRESADGWIDDVVALSRPWRFELSDITVPALLWHGGEDVFSPVSHTKWLAGEISTSVLDLRSGIAHFGAVEILPEVLAWVLCEMNTAAPAPAVSGAVPAAPAAVTVSRQADGWEPRFRMAAGQSRTPAADLR
jgi:pimeloyl-ACP methyl ester carboxylesterase